MIYNRAHNTTFVNNSVGHHAEDAGKIYRIGAWLQRHNLQGKDCDRQRRSRCIQSLELTDAQHVGRWVVSELLCFR